MSKPDTTLQQRAAFGPRPAVPRLVYVVSSEPPAVAEALRVSVEACLDEHLAPHLLAQIGSLTLHTRADSGAKSW